MAIFIGIDGGKKGGITAINSEQSILFTKPTPIIKGKRPQYDMVAIYELLKAVREENKGEQIFACLEEAMVIPISGRLSVFSTGQCFGMFQMALTVLEIPYEVVKPQIWQKTVLVGLNSSDTKEASILYCKRKFPQQVWRLGKSEKDADGLTDSCCIAVYCALRNKF